MSKKNLYLIAGLVWFAIIFYLLIVPGSNLPKAEWMEMIHIDKLVHIGIFFILCYTFSLYFKDRTNNLIIIFIISLLGLLYGIGMEFVQKYYVPGRSCEVNDMMADGAGAFTSYFWWLYKIKKPR